MSGFTRSNTVDPIFDMPHCPSLQKLSIIMLDTCDSREVDLWASVPQKAHAKRPCFNTAHQDYGYDAVSVTIPMDGLSPTDQNRPTDKSLAIFGSGADMATGHLIYKFGGVDLSMLAKLQEKGINSYDKAVKGLKDMNEELYFYTPRHRVAVRDQSASVDGLLLIVTPPPQASNTCFSTSTVDLLKESAQLFAKKKAVVLISTPEDQDWSESTYNDSVQNVRSGLQQLHVSTESILLIPSNSQGENFIELSSRTPWYTNATLIAALDEILE